MEASVSSLSDPHPNKTIFGMSILAQSKPTVRMTVSARVWSADYPNRMAWWRPGLLGIQSQMIVASGRGTFLLVEGGRDR
jgi:hypothetical protein